MSTSRRREVMLTVIPAQERVKGSRLGTEERRCHSVPLPLVGRGQGWGIECMKGPTRRASRGDLPTRGRYGSKRRGSAYTHEEQKMKLASYLADGRPTFGVVTGDRLVTMTGRTKYGSLRDALAAGALDEIRRAA